LDGVVFIVISGVFDLPEGLRQPLHIINLGQIPISSMASRSLSITVDQAIAKKGPE